MPRKDGKRMDQWLNSPVVGPLSQVQQPEYVKPVRVVSPDGRTEKERELEWANRLYQNDQMLYNIITKDREDSRFDFTSWWSKEGTPLFDRNASRVQKALMHIRGKALQVTRQEMAAYCGITRQTIYAQESTNWEREAKRPCALYWRVVYRWGFQCWGHLGDYLPDLQELRRWLPLLELKPKDYFVARNEMLSIPPTPPPRPRLTGL